jgi:hypothetical protein
MLGKYTISWAGGPVCDAILRIEIEAGALLRKIGVLGIIQIAERSPVRRRVRMSVEVSIQSKRRREAHERNGNR